MKDQCQTMPVVVPIIVKRDHNATGSRNPSHIHPKIGMKESNLIPVNAIGSRGSQKKPLRQWLPPQSFWLSLHACQQPSRYTAGWKAPGCSGWTPKSSVPLDLDHWNGKLGGVQQVGPSPTVHHGGATPAPLSCSTRSCL